jgi:AcrR family transcriptional regulator
MYAAIAPSITTESTAAVHLPGARAARDPSRAIKRGPSRVPPEVVAATQRERLYDGLVQVVAEKGYVNARVGDICLAAGVTRPAFYSLFAGKEDAFIATYRYGTDLVWSLQLEAREKATRWPMGVRSGIRALLNTLAAVPSFATMAIVEIDLVGPAARDERERLLRRFEQFFIVPPKVAPGQPPLNPDHIVASVVGGIYATIHRHVAAGEIENLPELLPALTYFALVPYLGPDDAAIESLGPTDDPRIALACLPEAPDEPIRGTGLSRRKTTS